MQSSRARLIAAGKSLFARVGYEQTSTAAIAHRAGTSESQLVRYFEGKAGLLQAIFDESWQPLNERALALIGAAINAREAILGVISAFVLAFEELTRELIVRGQKDGSFSRGFSAAAIASAVRGTVEGMIRDRLQAERSRKVRPFSEREIGRVLSAMLAGLSGTPLARPAR